MSEDNRYPPSSQRKLYKLPDSAKICGVCAGIAEYFGFETWVVRIIAVSLLLLNWFNGTIILAYFILNFILEPKPGSRSNKGCFGRKAKPQASESPDRPYRSSVKEVWQKGTDPKTTLKQVSEKFAVAETKLRNIESFVTSKQFDLEKEFNKMK
ncbi:envelope stress response membrane protein PspC [Aliikangiella sp. IMCC44653]